MTVVFILVYCIEKTGVFMSVCKFDTFENENEISQMIKSLQSKSIEYLKICDPWDAPSDKQIVQKEIALV